MVKWIGAVLIVVAAAGVYAWWSGWLLPFGIAGPAQTQNADEAANTDAATAQAQTSDLPTPATDTSTSAIEQDAAALDVQLQALQDDSASVDASLNDTAVPQEY